MTRKHVSVYLSAVAAGVVGAFIVAKLVGRFWPASQWIVFLIVLLIWLSGIVQVIARDVRAGSEVERAVFGNPEQWQAEELPQEFRFITRDTTVQQIVDKVGPYTRVTETGLVRYELPSGGALFLFPELPFSPKSKVRGVQLYRSEENVPVIT